MINVQDLRKGVIFKFEDDLWTVMTMNHIKPGKGGAIIKVRVRSHKNGNSKEMVFRSGERVEDIDIIEKPVTYSYKETNQYVFMDNETYEQYFIDAELCDDVEKYITPNSQLTLNMHNNEILSLNIPNTTSLKVVYSEPSVKGNTATRPTKMVKVETGFELNVPMFINEGDFIKIDTETGEYLERIKS